MQNNVCFRLESDILRCRLICKRAGFDGIPQIIRVESNFAPYLCSAGHERSE
jgi:hypothetical protein